MSPAEALDTRPRIMTVEEVASYLRISRSTVYRMARQGYIPASRVGGFWRFRKDVIDHWLTQKEARKG